MLCQLRQPSNLRLLSRAQVLECDNEVTGWESKATLMRSPPRWRAAISISDEGRVMPTVAA